MNAADQHLRRHRRRRLSAIAVWILQLTVKVDIPPAIAAAITTLIMAIITQFVPDRPTSAAPASLLDSADFDCAKVGRPA